MRSAILSLRLALVTLLAIGASAHAQVRRNDQQRPPSMTLEDYEPRSMLVTRETVVRRAKYPFVDIHGHQDLTMSDADLASLVKQMDAMNMRTMNNLSGGWGTTLAAQVRNVRAKYPGRFTVFANVDWSRVNVNGSSVAVGHPWAATGGRILATLAYEMKRRDARRGLISICAAGGMAGAFLLTRN